jgi:MarR family transcriptional regulator, organic hydroperoxide resistance regulator
MGRVTNQEDAAWPGSLLLDEQLCFALYAAQRAVTAAYRPLLDELGLTYPQYIAIVALWEEEDQTVSRLGEKLFLESNTLTPILKKLESMGYLTRRRDPKAQCHQNSGSAIPDCVSISRIPWPGWAFQEHGL